MVRDKAPRRLRLTTFTTAFSLALVACGSSPPPRKGTFPQSKTEANLGRLNESWYPENYPLGFVHGANAFQILADDWSEMAMRPAPLETTQEVEDIRRKILPPEARPKPEPPPPNIAPPLSEPVLDTTPVSPEQATQLETEAIENAEKPVLHPKLAR